MKNRLTQILCTLALFGFLLPQTTQAQGAAADTVLTLEQWASFSENIIVAIREGNKGEKEGALRQISRFGDYLTFNREVVFDVMRVYRDHEDDRMRRLAVVALGKMKDRWAIEFIEMLTPFEENERVKNTMKSVADEYWKARGGRPY